MDTIPSARRAAVMRKTPAALILLALVFAVLMAPTPALAVPMTSVLTIQPALRVVPYKAEAVFWGELTDEFLDPVDGYAVQFQRSLDNAVWKTVEEVPSIPEPLYSRQYEARYALTRAAWFRFSFAGDDIWAPSFSQGVRVKPRVSLTTPIAPKVVRARRAFTAYGYLKPRHASGAVYVKIRCYRKSSSGAWVLKKIFGARDVNYRTYTKYRARVSLPKTGQWRLTARYSGTIKFAKTDSGARYLRAR